MSNVMNLNPRLSAAVGRSDAIAGMGGRIRTGLTCGFTDGPDGPRVLAAAALSRLAEATPPVLPKPADPRSVS
eukprot:3819446-Karenia_brevis.AAC.1